ncbi:MAG: VTT domain-containing protein [Flavobacteriales bacterium]|nr:VTT domain-containing protein [Flavobacteriales bacterium]
MEVWEFLKQLTNPESIIHHGGLFLLLVVIFAENGLVIGFFLPGDSLIFLAGLICASKPELLGLDITTLTVAMFCAAVCGSLFGYIFGRRVGPPLFERKDSMIFKRKYLDITQAFYQKHGGKTLVLGRFLPIIRTFAPIIAGVIKVPVPTFMLFNVVGGALWITSLSLLGFYLGTQFPAVEHYVGYIIIGFIGITTILLIRTYIKQRKSMHQKDQEPPVIMP